MTRTQTAANKQTNGVLIIDIACNYRAWKRRMVTLRGWEPYKPYTHLTTH